MPNTNTKNTPLFLTLILLTLLTFTLSGCGKLSKTTNETTNETNITSDETATSEEGTIDYSKHSNLIKIEGSLCHRIILTTGSSLLEDVNAHKYCNKPMELVDTMKEAGISDEDILRFMSLYVVKLFKEYVVL